MSAGPLPSGRAALLAALAALAFAAWLLRSGASELSPEVAYRTRAVQVALAVGRAPDRDRFLQHPGGAVVPFSPQSTALVAALARSGPRDPLAIETGGVGTPALERLVRALPRLGGLLATLLAYLAARHGLGCRPGAALAAAGTAALAPPLLVAEREGLALVEPLAAALLFAQFALLLGATRARDLSEATLSGMLAGAAGGLAVQLSCTALPLCLAAAVVLGLRAGRSPEGSTNERAGHGSPRADAWRAFLLFTMAAVAALALPPVGESTLIARVGAGVGTAGFWGRALAPALPLAVALVVSRDGPRAVRPASLAAAATLVAALAWLGAPLRAEARALETLGPAVREAALWLRANTPSPGPFNRADAPQDWCVLAPPRLAGTLAYAGRRPVAAADFPGSCLPGADSARAALELTDTGELALVLRELGVLYVLVVPALAAAAPEGSVHRRLALGTDPISGLELAFSTPGASVYRAELPPRSAPRMGRLRR